MPGFETSGMGEKIGESATDLSEGDEVYAYRYPGGGYTEYLAAPGRFVARKPASLWFEEAASVPLAGAAAQQGLVYELKVREGEMVLITATAGEVGTFAVQIASKALGARGIGTGSLTNYLRGLGAAEATSRTAATQSSWW